MRLVGDLMRYIYIGEVVNTHGIKGELRIISHIAYKKEVFVKGRKFYLGSRHQEMIVSSYRPHKNFDMVTFEGINDINEAIAFKGDKVYANRSDIEIDGYFDEDLIGLEVIDHDKKIGVVEEIIQSPAHGILVINGNNKNYMVPYVSEYIKKISLDTKTINIETIEGLIDEN